jgi:hypothetical protein
MNKKGLGTVGIICIIVAVVLIAVFVVAVILFSSNKIKIQEEKNLQTIPMFLSLSDEKGNLIEANYIAEYTNSKGQRIEISKGKLPNSINQIDVPINYTILVSCWSEDYYLSKSYRLPPGQEELSSNKTTLNCEMYKIGDLQITHSGDLNSIVNEIVLNISTQDRFNRLGICFSRTTGIKYVSIKDQIVNCDSNWLNYSSYDSQTGKYDYLENNTYQCGENTEKCEIVEGNRCKLFGEEIPVRLKSLVDSCSSIGNIINQTISIPIEVTTEDYKNSFDNIKIYLYDKDRRFIEGKNSWEWVSEYNGNVGNPTDFEYEIKYGV